MKRNKDKHSSIKKKEVKINIHKNSRLDYTQTNLNKSFDEQVNYANIDF